MYNIVHQTGSFVPAGNGLMRYQSGLDFNKDELIDFKSYIEQKQKELAENPPQNPFGDDIPVAEFSEFREYLSGKELSVVDPIQAWKDTGGNKLSFNPSYSVTDEEAEYFREKYGENYDEENLKDFFFELSEKGIISELDAMATTGIAWIAKLEVVGYVPKGASPLELFKMGEVQIRIGEKHWTTSRDFGYEYEEFKQNYTKDVITWEDYIQERLDFVEYLKGCNVIHQKEGVIPNTYHWNERQSRIEKTANIIKQIFG